MTAALPWRETDGGVELAVPTPPGGAANGAPIAFLAKSLGLPRSAVTIVAGERARLERLRMAGDGLAPRLAALVQAR